MLLDEVLSGLAGRGVRSMQTRFVSAPEGAPYAVWDLACSATGGDDAPARRAYSAAVVVYEHPEDLAAGAPAALEALLDARAVPWERLARVWDEDERVYLTEYDFSWSEKAPKTQR